MGNAPSLPTIRPSGANLKSSFFAMKHIARSKEMPTMTGSMFAWWLTTRIAGPLAGRFAAPVARKR